MGRVAVGWSRKVLQRGAGNRSHQALRFVHRRVNHPVNSVNRPLESWNHSSLSVQQCGQSPHQRRAGIPQFGVVNARKPLELFDAFGCQPHPDLAAVSALANPFGQMASRQPIDQPHRAMVPDEQSIGQLADGGAVAGAPRLNCQKHLMLLRLKPFNACGLLAEVEESTDLVTKFGENVEIRNREFRRLGEGGHRPIYIVSRYV